MMWESCCIPSMLHGSGTWVEITQATKKRLNTLQCWFVCLILPIGPGSLLVALLLDYGLLNMKIRICIEKIMIVFYIRSLESNTLANRGYAEQKGWPGLFLETSSICKHLDIADVNSTRLSKIKYKPTLNEAFHRRTKKKIQTAGK